MLEKKNINIECEKTKTKNKKCITHSFSSDFYLYLY